eukprot:6853358-Pyramimonas_sp.AAC.1
MWPHCMRRPRAEQPKANKGARAAPGARPGVALARRDPRAHVSRFAIRILDNNRFLESSLRARGFTS